MNVIYPHRRPAARKKSSWEIRAVRWTLIGAGSLVVLNLLLFGIYYNRAYPRTTMGTINVGNQSFSQIKTKAVGYKITNQVITLTSGSSKTQLQTADVGLTRDVARTVDSLGKNRSMFPLIAIFTKHTIPLSVTADLNSFNMAADKAAPAFHKDAVSSTLGYKDGKFVASQDVKGQDLDQQKLLGLVIQAIDEGRNTITVPLIATEAKTTKAQAQKVADQLQSSLGAGITLDYNGASQKISGSDIASWYRFSGQNYTLDDLAIRTTIFNTAVKMGVRPSNLTEAVSRAKEAVTTGVAVGSVTLKPWAQTKTYTYCAAARGVSTGLLNDLKERLTTAYADLRGWNADGQIIYKYAEGNCDFTVWLAAPDQMTSFGAICDAVWNCNVGTNVIINVDRWNNTSDAWKAYGGSIGDYRIMSINHESGHMLGFDHPACPGPNQPAPVMMQQSIDMKGCVFNIWPTSHEIDVLRRYIGL